MFHREDIPGCFLLSEQYLLSPSRGLLVGKRAHSVCVGIIPNHANDGGVDVKCGTAMGVVETAEKRESGRVNKDVGRWKRRNGGGAVYDFGGGDRE